ncbi:MAG: TonB-dependent receptor plug domain-containing protein [Marinilabiliaceae bacterium]|jgi:hypothetical protein|nr:TonB-dependent receptor plug domain-containing protein [Marinilabiliaceae bacterium]
MKRIALTLLTVLSLGLLSMAQEAKDLKTDKNKETYVRVKPDKNVLVIINNKRYDSEILDLIDPDKIEKIDVIKGENARDLYNEENVIVITPKTKEKEKDQIVIRGTETATNADNPPLIIINGIESTKEDFDKLSPDDIISVTVIKGEEAQKKYNSKNGVILIEGKKKE